ncbi:ATP-dependent DNA helicase, partial [Aphis craccivora]
MLIKNKVDFNILSEKDTLEMPIIISNQITRHQILQTSTESNTAGDQEKICPARERADSAHPPAPPCYRNRFPYGRMTFGDAQKTQFRSASGAFSRWTEYSTRKMLKSLLRNMVYLQTDIKHISMIQIEILSKLAEYTTNNIKDSINETCSSNDEFLADYFNWPINDMFYLEVIEEKINDKNIRNYLVNDLSNLGGNSMQSKIKKKGKHVDQNEMEERIKYHLAQASFSVKRLNLTIKLYPETIIHNDGNGYKDFHSLICAEIPDPIQDPILHEILFNMYLVDMYAKIETKRLNFIRYIQCKLRVDNYIHLQDSINNEIDPKDIGQLVVLPSSFTGGPRYMHERTQDAMTYVRLYGKPDIFLTFTCNPNWSEIQENLYQDQRPQDRHDLIARLPHVHILIWLENKIRPDDIDTLICAKIPDPIQNPILHEIVRKNMIHGPCGTFNGNSECMSKGKCTKKFPKHFTTSTITGEDGYPNYRRRCIKSGGFSVKISCNGVSTDIGNQWVVPYNPVLLRLFDAHINIEHCSSIKAIKYICKYINKGSDQATFSVEKQSKDEITSYQSGRYVSSSEAVWRILSFPIHERYPSVFHLSVHLENGQ